MENSNTILYAISGFSIVTLFAIFQYQFFPFTYSDTSQVDVNLRWELVDNQVNIASSDPNSDIFVILDDPYQIKKYKGTQQIQTPRNRFKDAFLVPKGNKTASEWVYYTYYEYFLSYYFAYMELAISILTQIVNIVRGLIQKNTQIVI